MTTQATALAVQMSFQLGRKLAGQVRVITEPPLAVVVVDLGRICRQSTTLGIGRHAANPGITLPARRHARCPSPSAAGTR